MADYKERFEKWQREAKERFEDFDKQIGLTDKIGEGAKIAIDTAQKGAEILQDGAEKIKSEAEKCEVGKQAVKVAGDTYKTAEGAGERVMKRVSRFAKRRKTRAKKRRCGLIRRRKNRRSDQTWAKRRARLLTYAGERAGEVFDETHKTVSKTARNASNAFNFGASWTRTFNSAWKTLQHTADWVTEKPLQAATTGVSVAIGAGLGVVFTGFSSHWLFSSAIPTWSVKKVSEQFNGYLKTQEDLVTKGDLDKSRSRKNRVRTQHRQTVGAPLLGSFSFASGAVMMTNVINPKTVTGAPLDWLLGRKSVARRRVVFRQRFGLFQNGLRLFYDLARRSRRRAENR